MEISKKLLIRYFMVIADIIVMFISYALANKIKFGLFRTGIIDPDGMYLTLYLIIFVSYIIVFFIIFSNMDFITRSFGQEVISVLKMNVYILALTMGYIYITKTSEYYSRGQLVIYFVLSCIFILMERQSLKRIITKSYHRSGANEKIMLVTTSDQALKIVNRIKQTRNWYFRISNITIVDKNMMGTEIDGIEVVSNKEFMIDTISVSEIDSVLFCLPEFTNNEMKEKIDEIREMGKSVHVNIEEYNFAGGNKKLEYIGKYAVVTYTGRHFRVRYMFMKRILDIIVGLIGTIFLALISIFVAIANFLEKEPGHNIISLVKVGKNGRRFYEYKYRTMHMDAADRYDKWLKNGKKGNDPRYTKTGKALKVLGFENLPTAWNLLWGDLSLVGTKAPSLPEFIDYPAYRRKSLSVKPGITGLWQVDYVNRTRNTNIETMAEADLNYIENWSVFLDIKIAIKSIMQVFKIR